MGKKNSKLKDYTLHQLTADTYCEYYKQFSLRVIVLVYILFLPHWEMNRNGLHYSANNYRPLFPSKGMVLLGKTEILITLSTVTP